MKTNHIKSLPFGTEIVYNPSNNNYEIYDDVARLIVSERTCNAAFDRFYRLITFFNQGENHEIKGIKINDRFGS